MNDWRDLIFGGMLLENDKLCKENERLRGALRRIWEHPIKSMDYMQWRKEVDAIVRAALKEKP